MPNALPSISTRNDRIILADIDMRACISYDGPGTSLDQFSAATGEKINFLIEEQAEGLIGSRLTLRAFELKYHQAQSLLSYFATLVGEEIETPISEMIVKNDLALRPIFTFRSRDLNALQVAELVYRHAEL